MTISRRHLQAQAGSLGFDPRTFEKVARLLELLDALRAHPYLRDRLVLKGGTALNLFQFDVPRLSVDIDLNYIGASSRDTMLAERPLVEQALQAVFARENLNVRHQPPMREHAGGKWSLTYASAVGQNGRLEVDVNYTLRVPLWPVRRLDSRPMGDWHAMQIPVLDVHELAAGKLAALLSRTQARDLFDAQRLLALPELKPELLRPAFVVYGAMNRVDWRSVTPGLVDVQPTELARQLLPTLRAGTLPAGVDPATYSRQLVRDCQEGLAAVLPFDDRERAFLDTLLDRGEIQPALLTDDPALQQRIRDQPMLAWKAQHVRSHKGIG